MRVLYKDEGLVGWHSPVLASSELQTWVHSEVAKIVVTSRGRKGIAVRESIEAILK